MYEIVWIPKVQFRPGIFYPNIHPVRVDRALFSFDDPGYTTIMTKAATLEGDGVYVDEKNRIEFEKQWDAELRIKELSKHMKEFDNSRAQPRPFSSGGNADDYNRLKKDSEVRIFEIPGLLAKHQTKALGDYGAKGNFINEKFAIRIGLPINRDAVCKVTVGSRKSVTTVGAVTAPFRFQGEHDVHHLKFHLLPDCIHDVILGKPFLKLTKTLSKLSNFYNRVKERIVKGISQAHLCYLGASSPMFEGSINGQPQPALADSGAKVLVMDEAYARSTGVSIQTEHEHRTRLKFADNSTADTSGMAYGVEWRFGRNGELSSPYRLNFHILENAPANVILCDTFLYDNEAFSRYRHCLVDNDDDYDEDDESHCFAIDRDRRMRPTATATATATVVAAATATATTAAIATTDVIAAAAAAATATASSLADSQYLELVRRGKEADRISNLPAGEQTAAQNIENQRCAEWDRLSAASQANNQAQNPQQPPATPIAQSQSIQAAHSRTTSPQVSGSSQRPFLKWPTWLKR